MSNVTNDQIFEAIRKTNQNVVKLYGALSKLDKVQETVEAVQNWVSHNNQWGQANNEVLNKILEIVEQAKADRDAFVTEIENSQPSQKIAEAVTEGVTRLESLGNPDGENKIVIAQGLPTEVTTEEVQKIVDSLEEIPDEPNDEEQNNEQETKS